MRYAVLMCSLIVSFLYLGSQSYAVNCMWDNSCEEDKYNVDFCGNGYCEEFESRSTCLVDCGSILDLLKSRANSVRDKLETGSGLFGSVMGSTMLFIVFFMIGVVVFLVAAMILIWLYNSVVASVERETPIDST